jgi:hypothetical protein
LNIWKLLTIFFSSFDRRKSKITVTDIEENRDVEIQNDWIPCDSIDGDDSNKIINGKLVITVTDTGAGLSEANQAKLFHQVVQFNPEVLQVYIYIHIKVCVSI